MAVYDKNRLLQYISTVSFAVNDAGLFLDTHPEDKEALSYFRNYNRARNNALKEYASVFGPLTIREAESENRHEWVMQPWPWEMEG